VPLFVLFVKGKQGGKMMKIALLLVAVVGLTVIGCQPPEGMTTGVTQEQFDELKAQVDALNTDVMNLHTALDSLTAAYNAHIEKYHKGSKTVTQPPAKIAPEPPPRKIK
jgi:outer membrane murein-binding lipoprotein Lpp